MRAPGVRRGSTTITSRASFIARRTMSPHMPSAAPNAGELWPISKIQAGKLGLDFDALSALMADLKTIDAQLGSSKPKTTIIRECLRSLKGILEESSENEILVKIRGLLGE